MLKAGDRAPDFRAQTVSGREAALSDLLKTGPVTLIFLRYIGCPICRMRISEILGEYARFQDGKVHLLITLESSRDKVSEYASKRNLPDIFLADAERKLFDLYDVRPGKFLAYASPATLAVSAKAVIRGHMHGAFEGHEFQVPAEFTVRQDGILAFAHYGRHPADNAPVKEILGSLGF